MKILLISLLFISGCNLIPIGTQPKTEPVTVSASKPVSTAVWEVKVLGTKREGRLLELQDGYKEEAVDTWFIVEVAIKNRSQQRQNSASIPVLFSKLETASGKTYPISATRSLLYSNAKQEPFQPGEERKFKLLFDSPSNEKPSSIQLDSFAEKPQKLNL